MRYLVMGAVVAMVVCANVGFAQEAAPAPATAPAMTQVESTLIKEVGYDAATQVLTIKLVGEEGSYEYQKVPESVYKELMAAESKGSFFAKNIKGQYEFIKK